MNTLRFQKGFINEKLEVFILNTSVLSLGAFLFGPVDTTGLQLGVEGPSRVRGSFLSQQKSLAWAFQPDMVQIYPGKELTSSCSRKPLRTWKM